MYKSEKRKDDHSTNYGEKLNPHMKFSTDEGTLPPYLPAKNSNEYSITDLAKPTAVSLFREQFSPDNKIQFNGIFKGNWTVKTNTSVKVDNIPGQAKLNMTDDVQINGRFAETSLQAKLKPTLISTQFDFGNIYFRNAFNGKYGPMVFNNFINPYASFEIDRTLKNHVWTFGMIYFTNDFLRKNFKVNIFKKESKYNWDLQVNNFLTCSGFFLNYLFTVNYANSISINNRKVLLGYEKNDINANLELNFKNGGVKDWKITETMTTLSYNLKENGIFGVYLRNLYNLRSDCSVQNEFGVGYSNKISKELDVKAKINLQGILSIFTNFKLNKNLSVQPSLLTSFGGLDRQGFMTLPFDFGLKIKFEQ